MLLRYLKKVTLKKATRTKQANGDYTEELEKVKSYKVQEQELDDEISTSIYGANVNKMLRVKSPKKDFERFLQSKASNKEDNISYYYVFIGDQKYKIVAVNSKGADLELVK